MGGCLTRQQREMRNTMSSISFSQSQNISEIDNLQHVTLLVQEGIKIKKNPHTGRLEGVPKQWSQKYNFPFEIDHNKTIQAKNLPQQIRPEFELPKQIHQFMEKNRERTKQFLKKKEIEKQNDIKEAAQHFSVPISLIKSNLAKSNWIDSSNISELNQDSSILDVITNFGNEIYESKYQRKLLSTSQFKQRLDKIKFRTEKPATAYNFVCQIGKGSMCKVFKAVDHKDKSKIYAVRIITLQNQKYLQKIKQEIAVMMICQNRNIVKYYFSYYYLDTLFMFIQYMKYGALNHFIAKNRKNIQEPVMAYIIREILRGLDCIHRYRQLHRDLKSDNILIGENGDIKIGDFGYALQFTKEKTTSKQLAGTPAWMAPQLIKKQQYTESVDIWSLGIILVQLCEGQPRYLRIKPLIAMVMIASKPPETVSGRSQELRNFLGRCLRKDPSERATAKELLSDPFILSIGAGELERKKFMEMINKSSPTFF